MTTLWIEHGESVQYLWLHQHEKWNNIKRKRLFRPLHTRMKFSVKEFLVNVIKSSITCVFG